MNWTILTDNRSEDSRLLTEHGLSVYVETSQHKLLLDTEELLRIANHLKAAYPDVHFYTSHCTGDAALQTLQQVLGAQIQGFSVGHAITTHRTIRLAEPSDMSAIMQVMDAAKQIMRASGNLHQWVNGYPSEAVIAADIEKHVGYLIEEEGRIIAYFAFIPSPEPTYAKIYEGQWLDDEMPYHVIHRIGSYPNVHHVFDDIMEYCFSCDPNIRIDTHRDNNIMQHNIGKHGFTYCGIIYLANGDERLAYQKTISLQ